MMKRSDESRDSFAAIIFQGETLIACAGKMNHLERRLAQQRQRFDDGLIDSARALASAHDQHCCDVRLQSELLPGRLSIQAFEFGADRRASDFGPHFWKKCRALFEAEQNGA